MELYLNTQNIIFPAPPMPATKVFTYIYIMLDWSRKYWLFNTITEETPYGLTNQSASTKEAGRS